MKKIILFTLFSLAFSISSFASEQEMEVPTWLEVHTNIQDHTKCEDYIGHLASDLLNIRDAVSNAKNGIYNNESVGAEYSSEFREEGIRLSQAREALDTLFLKAMKCNSTSGELRDSN